MDRHGGSPKRHVYVYTSALDLLTNYLINFTLHKIQIKHFRFSIIIYDTLPGRSYIITSINILNDIPFVITFIVWWAMTTIAASGSYLAVCSRVRGQRIEFWEPPKQCPGIHDHFTVIPIHYKNKDYFALRKLLIF